jgi:mannose-1-phosphate guanylyltransferase
MTWITEEEPLGTCGAIVGALDRLDETFLVLNGDVLTDLDLEELVAQHRKRSAVATIALTPVDDARPYGLVETGDDGRVLAFNEKPADPIPGTINAGTYVLETHALEGVPRDTMVSIERETFPDLITRGEPVYAFTSDAYWRDLGTPAAYLAAHEDALAGRIGGRTYPRPLIGEGAEIAADAEVGERVVVGPGVRLGAGASVDRSVLHTGVSVGEGADVVGTLAGPRAEVGRGASVRDAVLAEGARVAPEAVLEGEGVRPGAVAGA